jgi:hypothetical protein
MPLTRRAGWLLYVSAFFLGGMGLAAAGISRFIAFGGAAGVSLFFFLTGLCLLLFCGYQFHRLWVQPGRAVAASTCKKLRERLDALKRHAEAALPRGAGIEAVRTMYGELRSVRGLMPVETPQPVPGANRPRVKKTRGDADKEMAAGGLHPVQTPGPAPRAKRPRVKKAPKVPEVEAVAEHGTN